MDKLWDVVINPKESTIQVNAILRKDTATHELASWYHTAMGFPSLTTLNLKKKNLQFNHEAIYFCLLFSNHI